MQAFQLWHFETRLINYQSKQLLRFTHRTGQPIYNNQPSQDIDPSNQFKDPQINKRATEFIRSLSLKIPLPAPPKLVLPFLLLRDPPSYDDWLQFFPEESYNKDDYLSDSKIFWDQYLKLKTHAELWRRTNEKIRYIRRIRDPQQAAKSAGVYLWIFAAELERLNNFYGHTNLPIQVQGILDEMHNIKKILTPTKKKID